MHSSYSRILNQSNSGTVFAARQLVATLHTPFVKSKVKSVANESINQIISKCTDTAVVYQSTDLKINLPSYLLYDDGITKNYI